MAKAYPSHPLVSCHALIRDGTSILLVERKRPPHQGCWSLPGGGVELGETVEEALRREVREETGLEIGAPRFLNYVDAIEQDDTGRIRYHYVILYFEAEVAGGRLRAGDDAAAAEWVPVAGLEGRSLTDAVGRCLEWSGLQKS